ncbi:MAG: hypothetical protein ABJE10_05950 [bacterium]
MSRAQLPAIARELECLLDEEPPDRRQPYTGMSMAMEREVPLPVDAHADEIEQLDRLRTIIDAASETPNGLISLLSRTKAYEAWHTAHIDDEQKLSRLASIIDDAKETPTGLAGLLARTKAFQARKQAQSPRRLAD